MEKINIYNIKDEKLKVDNFNFIIPIKITESKLDKFIPSSLGLKIHDSLNTKNYGFLYHLKEREIIDSFGWTIQYNNEEEGELIIGGYPHEYDKNYDKSKLKNTKAELRNAYVFWDLYFSYIKSGDFICSNIIVEFDISFGLIQNNQIYQNFIINNYFILKKKCEKFNNIKFDYFICDINEKIDDFPIISFNHKGLNYTFEFNYQDLFLKVDNKFYFFIVFKDTKDNNWKIGKPFFKKYQLIFESDRKLIGFYTGKIKSKINFNWIIVFILFIILIILIIFMIIRYKNLPKKIRAKELNEELNSSLI